MMSSVADDDVRRLPSELWEQLRADPARAPEHVALAAARVHGPAAARWIAEQRSLYAHGPAELATTAKRKHAAYARFGGAATGVGGFVTLLPDLAALAWIQSRLVFFVAAAYGFDPRDPMRPAELLVLQEVYDDVLEARAALDGAGTHVALAMARTRLAGNPDEELASRLMRFAGKRMARRYAGKLIPGVAVVINAVGNERDTRALGDRAIAFYGG
jgi:hypothetical protein